MSLTDDWKAGKLNSGWYFVKIDNEVYPDYYNNYFVQSGDVDGLQVLAHCNYDHISELEKEVQTLTNNYNLLKKQQVLDIAHGQALVDEFGDYEVLYEELQRLRKIAAKYNRIKINGNYPDKISRLKSRIKHLLDLQANQDKEVEKLRNLLWECEYILSRQNWAKLTFSDGKFFVLKDLLARINEVLK